MGRPAISVYQEFVQEWIGKHSPDPIPEEVMIKALMRGCKIMHKGTAVKDMYACIDLEDHELKNHCIEWI